MQIVIEPLVTQKQVELVKALINRGYFATDAAAFAYANEISDLLPVYPGKQFGEPKTPPAVTIMLPIKPTAILPGTFCLM